MLPFRLSTVSSSMPGAPEDIGAKTFDGELAITDEASGSTTTYGPGDFRIIAKGSAVVRDIRSDSIRKSYLAAVTD